MHEVSFAQGILKAALKEANAYNALRITRIVCRVGRLRQVEDSLLQDAFAIIKEGTLAATASLEVTYVGTDLDCSACGANEKLTSWRFDCPKCGSCAVKLTGGDDMELTSIEAEVPDEHPGSQTKPV